MDLYEPRGVDFICTSKDSWLLFSSSTNICPDCVPKTTVVCAPYVPLLLDSATGPRNKNLNLVTLTQKGKHAH